MRSGSPTFPPAYTRTLLSWFGIRRGEGPFLSPRWRRVAASVLLLGMAIGLAARAPAAVAPDDKWRIVCQSNAVSDGVIVFRLTPVGGQPLELQVQIKSGTFENDVAGKIRNDFRAVLAKDLYEVETDDGEAVLVKKRHGKPNFALEFVSNSVNGLGILVKLD